MKKKASWFCGIWNGRKTVGPVCGESYFGQRAWHWYCSWGDWSYWELPVIFLPSAFPMTQVNVPFHKLPFLTTPNIYSMMGIGESRKLAAFRWGPHPGGTSDIHGPRRAPQPPWTKGTSMKVFSIWRCAGSAGVRLSVESGKDANERLCRDYL